MSADELLKYISGSKTAILSAHVNPDGDAVGAVFAAALAFTAHGIKPVAVFENYPEKFDFLAGREFIYRGDYKKLEGDVFISLDCATKQRLGKNAGELFDRVPKTVNIDHHISNANFAAVNYVEPQTSSTCEILYKIMKNRIEPDADIASALYAGIVFDTGGFRHCSTTPGTLAAAAELVATGIDFSQIYREVMLMRSIPEAKLFASVLRSMKIRGPIAYACVSRRKLASFGGDSNALEGIIEYFLNLREVSVAALFSERTGGKVKTSLRSIEADVCEIAAKFGGGGHKNAAGATVEGKLADVAEIVIKEIEASLL